MYGLTAVSEYLRKLSPSRSLTETFEQIARHEQTLITPLLNFLKSKEARGVRIVGEERPGADRVPTISFVVVGERPVKSRDIVNVFDQKGEVCSLRLCKRARTDCPHIIVADWYPLRSLLRLHAHATP